MTAIAVNPPPMEYFKSGDNEGSSSSSSASSTSSVSAPSRPPPAFHRSASSPSMNHCWALKTSLHPGAIPMQPVIKGKIDFTTRIQDALFVYSVNFREF